MSGIARAIDNIVNELPSIILDVYSLLKDAAITVLVPIMLAIIALVTLIRILEACHRLLHPPDARQLHQEALAYLKKGNDNESRRKAKRRLMSSIQKDSSYLPSRLSLAALLLYKEENIKEAERVIQDAQKLFPENKDLVNMMLDADAMKRNLKHMVLAGRFPDSYLIDYNFRKRRK
jgi:cellobiose-specific phosphotransferase system component IIA